MYESTSDMVQRSALENWLDATLSTSHELVMLYCKTTIWRQVFGRIEAKIVCLLRKTDNRQKYLEFMTRRI